MENPFAESITFLSYIYIYMNTWWWPELFVMKSLKELNQFLPRYIAGLFEVKLNNGSCNYFLCKIKD